MQNAITLVSVRGLRQPRQEYQLTNIRAIGN